MKPSLPVAYGMKRKAMKNEESSCTEHCNSPCTIHEQASGRVEHEGNDVKHDEAATEETDKGLNQHKPEEMNSKKDGVVERAMKKRQHLSKGGMVANDHKSNRGTDYLATNDELEFNYTGSNSGDELSSPGEDHRRKDIVSKVMASRKKKDKLPNPR
jgi:hypothetical protein